MRLLRVIIFLLLAAFLGLAGYAYFGDMGADPQPMRVPVQLDMNQPDAAKPPTAQEAVTPEAADESAEADTDAETETTPTDGTSDANLD